MSTFSRQRTRMRMTGIGALMALLAVVVLAACGGSSSGGSSSASAVSSGSLSKAASNPNATIIVNYAIAPATLDPDFTEANQEVGID